MERDTKSVRIKFFINISEEHKVFLWLPAKTASVHAIEVFSHFSFESYKCDYQRQNRELYSKTVRHHHQTEIFQGHENYQLICLARNPIHRIFSSYIYNNRFNKNYSIKGFRDFFSVLMNDDKPLWLSGVKNIKRIPDYFVRQENLFEDYKKIPFIAESEFAKCGDLEELCNRKINNSETHNLDIREYYTNDMIDYLYHEYRWYFDKLNYNPSI